MSDLPDRSIPLVEPSDVPPVAPADDRGKMPEPLAVRLVAIEDVHLAGAIDLDKPLDQFYVELLGFVRQPTAPHEHWLIYRADNFRLIFSVREPPFTRQTVRLLGIEIPSLADAERKLLDARIPCERRKGLMAGDESLVLQDPAGNWLELLAPAGVR